MKVWIKYLIGVALGVAAAFIFPANNAAASEVLTFLTEVFVRFGRYFVVPIVFSTAVVAVNKLRLSKLFFRTALWTILIIIISAFMFTLVGIISILIVKLPRIPITVDVASDVYSLDIKGIILSLFPNSAFDALKEGSFLLVPLLFGSLIGWESASEQNVFKPVFTLADSLSKLFYNISVFFTEIMSVLLVAIMCNWVITFRDVISTGIYTPVIIMFVCDFVLIVGVIYPVIIRYLCHDPHPYKVLYASVASMVLAFVSGDSNLVLPLNIRHGKESLGIRRRCGGFTYPMFSIFARGGSSMVVAISFILIWRSYSSLPIPATDILWLFLLSFALSFLLGGIPSGGAFILLTIICQKYGKGFETSFLLLKPMALVICSFASVLDAATAMFGSYIVAVKTKMVEHHTIQHFI